MNPPTTPLKEVARSLRWSGTSHAGRVRQNNEDSLLVLRFDGREVRPLSAAGSDSLTGADFIFAVSDGMSGARSGEVASRIASERIAALFPKLFRLSAAGMASGFPDALSDLFSTIHQELADIGRTREEHEGMGATLSLCWFRPDWLYFGHVGDSRIYYLPREMGLTQVSHDHTHVGWLRRRGQLTEREARTHPRRNALNQALGSGQFLEPQVGAIAHRPGDRFLLCSDGLVDGLWDWRLEEALRSGPTVGEDAATRLVAEALDSSGRDNTTALVVEVAEPPPP